jgi:hypothetical protein
MFWLMVTASRRCRSNLPGSKRAQHPNYNRNGQRQAQKRIPL